MPDEPPDVAASGQRRPGTAGPSMASDDAVPAVPSHSEGASRPAAVARIAEAWPGLPAHIREAILTLVDAGKVRTG